MAAETIYLNLAEVVAAHTAAMIQTGAAPTPLRDEARLESAIARPRMAAYYEDADLVTQGVVLMLGISQAQAFVDGNKRTALTAALAFLRVNGLAFHGDSVLLAVLLEEAATQPHADALAAIVAWLRPQLVPHDQVS
jgi:death-on-curing protein